VRVPLVRLLVDLPAGLLHVLMTDEAAATPGYLWSLL